MSPESASAQGPGRGRRLAAAWSFHLDSTPNLERDSVARGYFSLFTIGGESVRGSTSEIQGAFSDLSRRFGNWASPTCSGGQL